MKKNITILYIISIFILSPSFTNAEILNIDAKNLVPTVALFFSPNSGSFIEESIFEVPIVINTKDNSINGVELEIKFDKDKLSVIGPSGKTSIIGVWVDPPSYDNSKGIVKYVGVIPEGIKTTSGLIGSITFKSKTTGKASVTFNTNSKILLNDGLGTEAKIDAGRAEYNIIPKAPEGVNLFSETHPFQSNWYSNNSPVISWEKDPGVIGFSYIFDNKPKTIPDNTMDIEETLISFEDLQDGLWYFHIKAYKNNVWGQTGHFVIKIDTTPPAEFKPEANYLLAGSIFIERTLISAITTDNLSGVSHYEMGIIDKNQPTTVSPVFVRAESPFQVPLEDNTHLHVIIRALDLAGNIRESEIDIETPTMVSNFFKKYLVQILILVILIGIITLILEYIIHHHVLYHIKRAVAFFKKDQKEEIGEESKTTEEEVKL